MAGFEPRAFLPSYGMAESTLAVTFADLDKPVRIDSVDPRPLQARAGRAGTGQQVEPVARP